MLHEALHIGPGVAFKGLISLVRFYDGIIRVVARAWVIDQSEESRYLGWLPYME